MPPKVSRISSAKEFLSALFMANCALFANDLPPSFMISSVHFMFFRQSS